MIHIRHVTKAFGTRKSRVVALDQVSLSVESGMILGLLGPNGAGKTTLLRMVAGLVQPDSGTLTVDGYDPTQKGNEVRSRLSFLTGEMKITGKLTPRELLQYWGRLHGMERLPLKTAMEEMVERFQMAEILERPADALSIGNKQKTLLAMSLLHAPRVLILDEPSNGLDIGASRALTQYLRNAKEAGRAIIVSSHIFTEIEKTCDQIGILNKGRLIEVGTYGDITRATGTTSLEDAFYELTRGAP